MRLSHASHAPRPIETLSGPIVARWAWPNMLMELTLDQSQSVGSQSA